MNLYIFLKLVDIILIMCDADFNIINNEKYCLIIKCIKYEK